MNEPSPASSVYHQHHHNQTNNREEQNHINLHNTWNKNILCICMIKYVDAVSLRCCCCCLNIKFKLWLDIFGFVTLKVVGCEKKAQQRKMQKKKKISKATPFGIG